MKRIIAIMLAAAGLAGCETAEVGPPPPPPPPVHAQPGNPEAFRAADFAWSTVPGSSAITGVLAYRGEAGRYRCDEVVLAPETPWSRARMRVLYFSTNAAAIPVQDVKSRTPTEHAAEYNHFARRTRCDSANRFSFSGLPEGAWYVVTVATPVSGGAAMAVMRRVQTYGGTTRVVLR